MNHLVRFESQSQSPNRLSKAEIRSYFYDFIDEFDILRFVIGEEDHRVYEIFISIESTYWQKHRSKISEVLHDCITQLLQSTGMVKNGSENKFGYLDNTHCRIIRKSFRLK